jgi:hypothetical protein
LSDTEDLVSVSNVGSNFFNLNIKRVVKLSADAAELDEDSKKMRIE